MEISCKDVSHSQRSSKGASARPSRSRGGLHALSLKKATNVLELLQPGSFVTIENQPNDLPPFQVLHCKGGRCWVRQQTWGQNVHWEVEHHRLKSA